MTQVLQLTTAIDNFIVGCKTDGIWDPIKACCILAAWDGLSGALVPLKGAQPTNFNFVAGDYNRKTGLVGNGSSKYLNTNRNNNADPQNNQHMAVWVSAVSTVTTGASQAYIGARNAATPSGSTSLFASPDLLSSYGNSRFDSLNPAYAKVQNASLYAISRSSASGWDYRLNQATNSVASTSVTPNSDAIHVFTRGGIVDQYSAHRLAFYSIGESLDLAKLDARVTLLMAGIQVSVDGYDPDAAAYIAAVETADGQSLEFGVKSAINQFVVGCKQDGIWSAIKASCILAGARTLSGALVPLVGTAPTNNGPFVAGDYNRKTGLVGNGSTKYLNSNYAFPANLQNNCHLAGFMSTVDTVGVPIGAYGDASANGSYISSRSARLYQESTSTFIPSDTTTTGFRGVSRSSASSYLYRRAGLDETANIASFAVTHQVQGVFARRRSTGSYDSFTDARLAFYSIGESLDLAKLDARVTALINAFGAAIP